MRNRASQPRPAHGPLGGGVPRALRPYKPWNSAWIVGFLAVLLLWATVMIVLTGHASWVLVFPWLTAAGAGYCYIRERPCKTVIPGALWGLGLALCALGTIALLLLLH